MTVYIFEINIKLKLSGKNLTVSGSGGFILFEIIQKINNFPDMRYRINGKAGSRWPLQIRLIWE